MHPPAKKLADWYEFYVNVMDLNVWAASTVSKATRNNDTGKWSVSVTRADGSERTLHVDHFVFATGWIGDPRIPEFPGKVCFRFEDSPKSDHLSRAFQSDFDGEVLHSSEYHNAKAYIGKKIVVVGACSTG